jgi:hypothetical protein
VPPMDARHLLLSGALLIAAGCATGCAEDPGDRPTEFHYLHASIIRPNCATIGCHSYATQQGSELGPLDLSTPEAAYLGLTGLSCGDADATHHVSNYVCQAPNPLCKNTPVAELTLRLEGKGPNPYPVMPADHPLPDAEQQLLIDWVNEGAPCEP